MKHENKEKKESTITSRGTGQQDTGKRNKKSHTDSLDCVVIVVSVVFCSYFRLSADYFQSIHYHYHSLFVLVFPP